MVEREVERMHGQLLEELAGLRDANAALERDNRKLRLKVQTIDETLRQLREGKPVVYYDNNGMQVNPDEL